MAILVSWLFIAILVLTSSNVIATDLLDLSHSQLQIAGKIVPSNGIFLSEFDAWIPPTSNAHNSFNDVSVGFGVSTFILGSGCFFGLSEIYAAAVHQDGMSNSTKIWIGATVLSSVLLSEYLIPEYLQGSLNKRLEELEVDQNISHGAVFEYYRNRRLYNDGVALGLLGSTVTGLYYGSKAPEVIGGAYLFGLALGATAKGKTEITRLWYPVGISAYNFSIAKSQSQSDVFWTNIAMMGMWMVTDTLSTSDMISEEVPTAGIAIEPFIVDGSLGLAVSTGF